MKEGNKISILMIYGSPRKRGNTDELMNRFEKGLLDNKNMDQNNLLIDKIFIKDLKFSPCIECRHCSIDGECAVKDEMQGIYPKLINHDFIAISSPIFFTSVSGYLKAFIDRCQRFWALKYELKKRIIKKERKGIFISAAGSDSVTIFDCSHKVIRALFDVLYIKYDRDFVYNKIDLKGDILKHPEALDEVFEYARNLIIE
ncbi:flavodoxin family protein [bacterium]|nr:flavodoxin family protein [bacterium]